MKIDLKVLNSQKTASTTGSKKMKLSENATSMVFQMFTKLIYSNPIGTVVREITSNCFDSHIEAENNGEKINTPVVIKKSYDNEAGTHYISFIDFGVGMSPERINEVYMVYFESTKRVDNTQIGGFGIGGKTPLAYKRSTGQGEHEYDNSFYVITNYNGIKYYYCVYEGEEAPEVNLLHQEETTERNGTEVRIPVLEKDMETFEREMLRQLYYFENVLFEGFEKRDAEGNYEFRSRYVTNDYQIIRGKSFWYRGDKYDGNMHVCLGRVAYPIDYSALNIDDDEYNLPVAIKLEVGDIRVTASRENLDYNEQTIKVLKKKLLEAKAELIDMLKDQYANVQTLEDYFNVKENFGRLQFPNGTSIYIGNVIKKEDVEYSNFKYQFMGKIPDDATLFKLFFDAKLYGKKEGRGYYSHSSFNQSYKGVLNAKHIYYVDGEFQRKVVKQAYLKTQHERYYILSKNSLDDMRLSTICDIFNVHLDGKFDDKGNVLPYIKGLLEMQEEYFEVVRKHAENYDTLEVPEDFIAERKREKLSAETLKTTIPVKFIAGYYRTGNRPKVMHLVNFKGTIVYGFSDDERKVRNAYDVYTTLFNAEKVKDQYSDYDSRGFGKKGGIMFILISKGNEKYMNYCKNAFHVKDVYWKLFYRKLDYVRNFFMTYALQDKWAEIEDFYLSETIEKLSAKWGAKVKRIKDYMKSLPEKSNNLFSRKYDLKNYYDVDNIELSKEQKEILALIDDVLNLQLKNKKTMNYINLPYSKNSIPDELLLILAKVMSF